LRLSVFATNPQIDEYGRHSESLQMCEVSDTSTTPPYTTQTPPPSSALVKFPVEEVTPLLFFGRSGTEALGTVAADNPLVPVPNDK
jgi:hypothetical protein